MPRRLWIVGAVVLVLVAATAGFLLLRHDDPTSFEWAADRAPAGSQRLSWTDWAAVRAREKADLTTSSSGDDVRRFLDRAFDDDLSSTSALVTSAPVLQERFGFSPGSVDWEMFSQSDQGAVVMVHLPSAELDDVADHLRELGYTEPEEDDGVWRGGGDLLAQISPSLTPELGYVSIDRDDSVVLASDSEAFLSTATDALNGDGDRVTGLDPVVDDAGEPLAAAVYSGDYACGALAMEHAGASDQAAGRRLVADAGEVNPYTAFAMSYQPDGTVRVAFAFDSPQTARTNADSRATLARGPAPGQGGTFGERFGVDSVTASGSVVGMTLTPKPDAAVLSDLSVGPLLFATC